ncbi:hypothetical protein ACFSHP_20250 [Novosphingobium panipatense]
MAAIKDDAVTFRAMDGTLHDLKTDDRMLERLDLAYALTVHAAQGMTATSGILVMREEDRRLNSTRSFLVATTRVTDNLTLIVDNAQAVERAVSRNAGDKTSAIAIARDAAPSLPSIYRSFRWSGAGEWCAFGGWGQRHVGMCALRHVVVSTCICKGIWNPGSAFHPAARCHTVA